MAKSTSVLDIIIKTIKQGDGDKRVVSALVQVKSAAAAVTGTFAALAGTAYALDKAFDATVGATVDLANQVRSISQVSGLTAEESSKLIQFTDDLKISQEDLLKVMQKNGDQYDYSIAGLAKMSDEYLALTDANKKAEYMQERFGKSWGNFVELMEQGSGKIIAAGEGINEALILDQKALDQAREYEKQIDELSDSWMALKVAAGDTALPAVNDLLGGLNDYNKIQQETNRLMETGEITYRRAALAHATITEVTEREAQRVREAATARMEGLAALYQTEDALKDVTAATEEDAEAAKAASDANQTFLSLLGSSQSTFEKFEENNKKLTEERMELEAEKQELLRQGYSEQSQQVQDVNAKLEENKNKTTEVANQFELDNKRIILGYLERQLTADGTLTNAELDWLLEKGVAWGIYSETVIDETRRARDEANALIDGIIAEKTFTLSLNTIYSTYGNNAAVAGSGARRAKGGPVDPGGMYQVNEKNVPELLALDGNQYLMMPDGGNGGYVTPMGSGAGGGGNVSVTVNINSMVNTADREKVKQELLPVILDGIRSAQAQGLMR